MCKVVTIVVSVILLQPAYLQAAENSCSVKSNPTITPVIELYTSEGCSSCPPADRWLSKYAQHAKSKVNFLAFHVDYWDEIGWPDRFANHRYTERQRLRVQQNGSNTIYTPQVMISNNSRVSWHTAGESERLTNQISAQIALANISMHVQATGSQFQTALKITAPHAIANTQWYFAVYQDGLQSKVIAGENQGLTLNHDRVVRQWLGPYALPGGASNKVINIALPDPLKRNQTGFMVLIENSENGKLIQSLSLPLSNCNL